MSNIDSALSATATARFKALEDHYRASAALKQAEEKLRALDLQSNTLLALKKDQSESGDNQ